MTRDQLYLLKQNFFDKGRGPFFCPGCAQMVGLLDLYPTLKHHVKVEFIDFPRPRLELAGLLGEENQSCPVLVLGTIPTKLPSNLKVQNANGHAFVEGANEIAEYLAHIHGIGIPH